MPKGQPAQGFRVTRKRLAADPSLAALIPPTTIAANKSRGIDTPAPHLAAMAPPPDVVSKETDAEIAARIGLRFDVLARFTSAAIDGTIRGLIVSGPPGLGKSFTVEQTLSDSGIDEEDYTVIKGFVRPSGLYKKLYEYRHANNVIVFDDADSIFYDDTSLNLIKTACDSTEIRELSWLSEANLFSEKEADNVPGRFIFDATVIFITNLDFDGIIAQQGKMAPHLSALVSRAHYIDLTIKSKRDYIIRIKQVISQGMLKDFTATQRDEIIDFIADDSNRLREYSLRMAIKIGHVMKMHAQEDWRSIARITCCRN